MRQMNPFIDRAPKQLAAPAGGGGGCVPRATMCVNDRINPGLSTRAPGVMPVVGALCPSIGIVSEAGTSDTAYGPNFSLAVFFALGFMLTPSAKLFDSGTFDASALTLTLEGAAAVGTGVGNVLYVPGIVLELQFSSLEATASVDCDIAGTSLFGGQAAWTHNDIQFQMVKAGTASFFILPHASVANKAYLALAKISSDELLFVGATALTAGSAPNDATSITPTGGWRERDSTVTVTLGGGPDGAGGRIETLSPAGAYYDRVLDYLQQVA